MIKRNDAYSNLVELMFPFHLRFSIHAHNNAGPKFGISLLSKIELNNAFQSKVFKITRSQDARIFCTFLLLGTIQS